MPGGREPTATPAVCMLAAVHTVPPGLSSANVEREKEYEHDVDAFENSAQLSIRTKPNSV
jgi:hypothetical protein